MATWSCDNCTMENADNLTCCEVCDQKRPDTNTDTNIKKDKNEAKQSNKWKCDNCTIDNEASSTVCEICDHPKPVPSNGNNKNTNSNKWTCKTCTFENESSSLHCNMCKDMQPNTIASKKIEITYVWEWKGGNKWHEYPQVISNKIEKAYFDGTLRFDLNLSHAKYVIDLTKLHQINTSSNKTRKIQRVRYEYDPSQDNEATSNPTTTKMNVDADENIHNNSNNNNKKHEATGSNSVDINNSNRNKNNTNKHSEDLMDLSSGPENDEEDVKMRSIDNKPLNKEKKQKTNKKTKTEKKKRAKKEKKTKKEKKKKTEKKVAQNNSLLAMFEKEKTEDIPSPVRLTKKRKRKLSDIKADDQPKKKQKLNNDNKIKIAGKYSNKQSSDKEIGTILNKPLIDALWELSMIERNAGNKFKANAYAKACKLLRSCGKKIASGKEAQQLNGVGKKIAAKIDELLSTGHLVKLDKLRADDTVQAVNELCQIHGIGPKKAAALVKDDKIFTIEALRQRTDLLNDAQKVGLKYFEYINMRMPRDECTAIGKQVRNVLDTVDSGIVMDICGSYRRGKADCGDVDILLTHKDTKYDLKKNSKQLLADIVKKLKQSGLLVEDLAQGPVKYMGICRYEEKGNEVNHKDKMMVDVPGDFKFVIPSFDDDELMITLDDPDDNEANTNSKEDEEDGNIINGEKERKIYFRRIDLKFINYKFYYANLLYFTGSDRFNVEMRLRANEKLLILNENGIYKMLDEDDHSKKSKEPVVQPKCEKDIFDVIGMNYVEPKDRSW